MAENDRTRWAVLGTARTAGKRMIPAMLRAGDEVLAIAGRRPERLSELCALAGGARPYSWDAVDRLLADVAIEAVYIPLPNALHVEFAVKAINARKHVLVEKPLALSVAEVDLLVETARRERVVVVENFSYHLGPPYRALERLRSEDPRIVAVAAVHAFRATPDHALRYDWHLGGGSFVDLGCYAVDFAHRLLAARLEVVSVNARPPVGEQAEWGLGGEPVDVECDVVCRTAAAELRVHTSFVDERQQTADVTWSSGSTVRLLQAFRLEGDISRSRFVTPASLESMREFSAFDGDVALLRSFRQRVLHHAACDEQDAVRWRWNAAAIESARSAIREAMVADE